MDKKARTGKLTQKAFLDEIVSAKGYDEKNNEFDNDVTNAIIDDDGNFFGNISESQEQRIIERATKRAYTEIGKYSKRLFNRLIKGKKFKNIKEAQEAFLEDYNSTAYYNEDD